MFWIMNITSKFDHILKFSQADIKIFNKGGVYVIK